jgi:hypothetical protein
VLEETGWALGSLARLAVVHYRHLGPRPAGYPFPYPDFAQIVFLAEAVTFHPDARLPDAWVAESGFRPWDAALALVAGRESEGLLLEAALVRWRGR